MNYNNNEDINWENFEKVFYEVFGEEEKEKFDLNQNKTQEALFINKNDNNCEFQNLNSNEPKVLNIFDNINQSTTNKKRKRSNKKKKNKCENKKPKDRQDNKIIKIKTYLIKKHLECVNSLLIKKGKRLCKLEAKIKESIKKSFNIDLLNTTFKNIYLTYGISSKYKKKCWKTNNSEVINYIYNCDEDETIKEIKKLLDLTLHDICLKFGGESTIKQESEDLNNENFFDIGGFHNYLKYQKKKDEIDIDNYIYGRNGEKGVKDLSFGIDEWFNNKKKRKIIFLN